MKQTVMFRLLLWTGILIIVSALIFLILVQADILSENVLWGLIALGLMLSLVVMIAAVIIVQSNRRQKLHTTILTEELIEHEKNRFDSIFNYDINGIVLMNLDGKCLRVNKAFCELLGYEMAEALYLNFYQMINKDDFLKMQNNIQALLDDKIKTYRTDIQCIKKNNESISAIANISVVRDQEHYPQMMVLQLQNQMVQKEVEERINQMAYQDSLTGLDNRNKLEQNLHQAFASAKRSKESFGVMYVDIDKLKQINDTIGHENGDIFLQVIADRLKSAVRKTDIIARVGGDEFVVLIHNIIKPEMIAVIAIKIMKAIGEPVILNGERVFASASVGISLYPYDGETIQEILNHADMALYRAKENGKNCYQFFTAQMTKKAQERIDLLNAIENALIKEEFELYYQPLMNISTREIVCLEALLRWKNSAYRHVSIEEIISLSEDTGLIVPVSKWVIKTATQQLKKWHEMGMKNLQISINLTARPFKQPGFLDDMIAIFNAENISLNMLNVEVTESTIMVNANELIRNMYLLKDLGVHLVIDDFGMGYWSLNNLRRLSVNKIKINNTFVQYMLTDKISRDIVLAIIAMANKLGIISVAEGVETKEQYEFLKKEGCNEIQGYYITQPVNAEIMTYFLRHPTPAAEKISTREIK